MKFVAHRGFPAKFPENTLLSYRKAIENGAEYIETDVQLSLDLQPILYHDATLHRTSGLDVSIFDLDSKKLTQTAAHFPNRFGEQFQGERIPTLTSFGNLVQAHPDVHAFLEIKTESLDRFGLETVVNQILSTTQEIRGQCSYISKDLNALQLIRQRITTSVGWVVIDWTEENEKLAAEAHPEYVIVDVNILPPKDDDIWQGPWKWMIYSVNEFELAHQYFQRGFEYIETDNIQAMRLDSDGRI